MSRLSFIAAGAAGLIASVAGRCIEPNPSCPLQFDGRIPSNFTLAEFDAANSFYNPTFVLGADQKFSEVLKFPTTSPSLFDQATNTKPLEVTINDQSIFAPSADNVQVGFRRTELLVASNSGSDDSTTGVKTLHFSLSKDADRPLDLAHEYQLVFLEDASFSTNQFMLKTGAVIGLDDLDPDSLTIFGNANDWGTVLFTTPFTPDTFHNFALGLDFDANTLQIFYSTGVDELEAVTEPLDNDISGQGQYHFGVLKKGLGGNGDPKQGTQPSGIDEGIIYGGIFMEDSSTGCRSLS